MVFTTINLSFELLASDWCSRNGTLEDIASLEHFVTKAQMERSKTCLGQTHGTQVAAIAPAIDGLAPAFVRL